MTTTPPTSRPAPIGSTIIAAGLTVVSEQLMLLPGGCVAAGADADVDVAYDRAVDGCADGCGTAVASLATAGDLERVMIAGTRTFAQARRTAMAAMGHGAPGSVVAVPWYPTRLFDKKRARVVLEDVALPLSEIAGAVPSVPGELAGTAPHLEIAVAAAAGLGEDWTLDTLTVRSVRRRVKPLVARGEGKATKVFAVFDGDHVVSSGHARAGDARRAAVDLIRGGHQGVLVVHAVAGKDGAPLLTVSADVLSQKITVAATFTRPKDGRTLPPAGWVFAAATQDCTGPAQAE